MGEQAMVKRRVVGMFRGFMCECGEEFFVNTLKVIGRREYPCKCGKQARRLGRIPQWERDEVAAAEGATRQ
jgi:hypothetical protein